MNEKANNGTLPVQAIEPAESLSTNITVIQMVPAKKKKKKAPSFLSVMDLKAVVQILSATDKITPEQAIRRLKLMCEKGILVIVPPLGIKRR